MNTSSQFIHIRKSIMNANLSCQHPNPTAYLPNPVHPFFSSRGDPLQLGSQSLSRWRIPVCLLSDPEQLYYPLARISSQRTKYVTVRTISAHMYIRTYTRSRLININAIQDRINREKTRRFPFEWNKVISHTIYKRDSFPRRDPTWRPLMFLRITR